MKDEIVEELKENQRNIQRAIDYLELHSISKLELLQYLQEINNDDTAELVKGFYYKFFRDEEQDKDLEV